jgi:hypothetical protein
MLLLLLLLLFSLLLSPDTSLTTQPAGLSPVSVKALGLCH